MIQAHVSKGLNFAPHFMWQRKGFDNLFTAEIVIVKETAFHIIVDFVYYTGNGQFRPVSMGMDEFLLTFIPLGKINKPKPELPAGMISPGYYVEDESEE